MVFLTLPFSETAISDLPTKLKSKGLRITHNQYPNENYVRFIKSKTLLYKLLKHENTWFHQYRIRGVGLGGQKIPEMESYGDTELNAYKIWTPILKIPWNDKRAQETVFLSIRLVLNFAVRKGHLEPPFVNVLG